MRADIVHLGSLLFVLAGLSQPLRAQSAEETPADADETLLDAPQVVDGKVTQNGIEWELGPCVGKLGNVAEIQVPEGLAFTARPGTLKFLAMGQNLTGDTEVGMIMGGDGNWFVVFQFEDSGHVKDDEKDDIDADDLIDTLKRGVDAANAEKKRRGWEPLELVGWYKPPFYDPRTNNLTWSISLRARSGTSLNWTTKLLGRTGTMSANLVAGPEQMVDVLPQFEELIAGFGYVDGHKYAEFKPGDKLAEYGLTALIAGGAGAVAVKTGLFAKFWKLILAGVVAIGAALKKLFGFGKKDTAESSGS